ncbi:MAG: glycosyltransferase [Ekhidna sp.]|uniref:glycosyltransferase n=1 Tax=Ekhidna sp. TaxID=2608089 RepID=UPI0032EABC7F
MIFLIGGFTLLNVLFYLRLAQGWSRIPSVSAHEKMIPFSVIIPVRNEEQTIDRILSHLAKQDYPKDLFEVIIVDDFSEDHTVQKVIQATDALDIAVRSVQLEDREKQGKKHALTKGILEATHETILTTDADCWFGKNWIRSYNDAFDESTNMVAGPVAIRGKGLFARLQQVEFSGLMGFGAVTISDENPSMCSGANLGFRKRAFEEVGGYTNNLFTPSGDDEFLLFNIMRKFPHSTHFLKNPEAVVSTAAHPSLRGFINQRTRWTSKWKHNRNRKVRVSAVLFFLDYLFFYVGIFGAIVGWFNPLWMSGIVLLRFIAMLTFVAPVNRFVLGKNAFLPLLIFQFIYPLHVLFMGMNSIFGSYTWKGRKYG